MNSNVIESKISQNLIDAFRGLKSGLGVLYSKYNFNFPVIFTFKKDGYPFREVISGVNDIDGEDFPMSKYLDFLIYKLSPNNPELETHVITFYKMTIGAIEFSIKQLDEVVQKKKLAKLGNDLKDMKRFLNEGVYTRQSIQHAEDVLDYHIKENKGDAEVTLYLNNLLFSIRLLQVLPSNLISRSN